MTSSGTWRLGSRLVVSDPVSVPAGGKAVVLVVMHHTYNADYVVADSRRLVADNPDVQLAVDCLFYESSFLKCQRNEDAWRRIDDHVRPAQVTSGSGLLRREPVDVTDAAVPPLKGHDFRLPDRRSLPGLCHVCASTRSEASATPASHRCLLCFRLDSSAAGGRGGGAGGADGHHDHTGDTVQQRQHLEPGAGLTTTTKTQKNDCDHLWLESLIISYMMKQPLAGE